MPKPDAGHLATVRRATAAVLSSTVGENAWARAYLTNRPNDVHRYAIDLGFAKEYCPPGAKVCDHASAPFAFAQALALEGYDVTATDIDPGRFGDLRELGFEVESMNVEVAPLNGEFDAIFFSEIFEHCRIDLIQTMEALRNGLKPGGVLILSTPNVKSLSGLYNYLFRDYAFSGRGSTLYKEWVKLRKIGHCGHVREYTGREVADFLRDCGFSVERMIFKGRYNHWLGKLACAVFPRLRPYFTVVARRGRRFVASETSVLRQE